MRIKCIKYILSLPTGLPSIESKSVWKSGPLQLSGESESCQGFFQKDGKDGINGTCELCKLGAASCKAGTQEPTEWKGTDGEHRSRSPMSFNAGSIWKCLLCPNLCCSMLQFLMGWIQSHGNQKTRGLDTQSLEKPLNRMASQ